MDAATPSPLSATRSIRRRIARAASTLLIIGGLGLLSWAFVVWQWNDPFTSLYTRWEQRKLVSTYERIAQDYQPVRPIPVAATPEDTAAVVAKDARRFRSSAPIGGAIGRIVVPRLGLNMVMVNGTDTATLKRGPGRDGRTFMPGEGQLVYIAGHRTTYLAPFSAIDTMRPGDRITLKMPYATFEYVVTGYTIVDASELSVLKSRGREQVALQACEPRFFATQRYIVWAKPVRVTPAGGRPYRPVA
jgi:sortase A